MTKELVTSGIICIDDSNGFTYRISNIDYHYDSNEQFEYVFTPNYSVISLLSSDIFQGIPGIDLSKMKELYVRKQRTPVFISERTPPPNRVDLWDLLEKAGMSYLNRLEWLIRQQPKYSGDNLYVIANTEATEKKELRLESLAELANRSAYVIDKLLQEICFGNDIVFEDVVIDDTNRLPFYQLLMGLLKLEKTYIRNKIIHGQSNIPHDQAQPGRPTKKISIPRLRELIAKYHANEITADEAATALGVSRSTFYRRMDRFKDLER